MTNAEKKWAYFASVMGHHPFVQFPPTKYLAFKEFIGEWAFNFMQNSLNDPARISPAWAARFCQAVKEIGIDICQEQTDIYAFVTSQDAFLKIKKRSHHDFNKFHTDNLPRLMEQIPEEFRTELQDFLLQLKEKHKLNKKRLKERQKQKNDALKKAEQPLAKTTLNPPSEPPKFEVKKSSKEPPKKALLTIKNRPKSQPQNCHSQITKKGPIIIRKSTLREEVKKHHETIDNGGL
jgi:hypothetical protein